jgi:hypothetical protein
MSKSDRLVEEIRSKTNSGKLKWSENRSKVGDTHLSLYIEDDRPELAVRTDEATAYFDGPTVNELFKEVERLVISDDPELLSDLRDL